MPFTIPPFQQFQSPMVPLRGLWNRRPPEGDRFVSAEIDWLTPGINNCVQFQLSGNSPVPLSQIAALYVDNARCGSDVTFMFGDSGFLLVVPAYAEGLYPVLTNALMFYCSAPQAVPSDVTVVQILNSIPPPVPVQLGQQQQATSLGGIVIISNNTTQIVPATVSGTLNTLSVSISAISGAGGTGSFTIVLIDGTGKVLWVHNFAMPANSTGATETIPVTGLKVRFTNGISAQITQSANLIGGGAVVNLYYSVP